jgi:hypothetical protein
MFKKALFLTITATVILVIVASCSKDKTIIAPNPCDTPQPYSYSTHVKPIFDYHCASFACHSNIAQASSVDLSDYNNAKLHTELGNVLCAIKHTCTPMPKDEPMLPDSLIQVIECWAAKGFQN